MASLDAEPESLTDEQVEIVNDNIGLAHALAAESKERRIDLDDRRQAACLGLVRAVLSHDPAKGELSTHATWCIKAAIQQAARKSPSLESIDDMDGLDPPAPAEPATIDPEDAIRLRALVVSLPEQCRKPILDRFWRNKAPRGGRVDDLAVGLDALRRATQGGRSIPAEPPTWSGLDGRPIYQDRMSPDDTAVLKRMAALKLRPIFPPVNFSPSSPCPHKGQLPRGSLEYCPCCDKSGQDGLAIPTDVKALPVDKPKHAPPPPKQENRRERRMRERGKVVAMSA